MSSPALAGPPGPLRAAASPSTLGRFSDSIWAGAQFAAPSLPALPTGYPTLDAQLPGGGWPASGLTELLFDAPGSGEWRLLAPALRTQAAARPVVCIAPPLRPYAPALLALGLPLQRFVWVTPPDPADAAWALEQALRSGGCGTALWWGEASTPMLRRLHLAARDQGCLLLALRPLAARRQSSPAPLRLACTPAAQGRLLVSVFKRRGPAQAAALPLSLPPIALTPLDHAVARPAPALVAA
jgi:protein ImuA